MRRELLLLLVALLSIVANASVEIDGIWYNLIVKARQAEVTRNPSGYGYYSSEVNIPDSVTYDGKEFSVTSIGYAAFNGCSGLTDIYCYAENVPNTDDFVDLYDV